MSEAFIKVVRIGMVPSGVERRMSVYAKIVFDGRKLSITGVEGPKSNGDAVGGCGQIEMHMDADYIGSLSPAPGWTPTMAGRFVAMWRRWHLNDMVAGSPRQAQWLRDNPVEFKYPQSHYEAARDALRAAGLHPDTEYLHGGKPYAYGSAWLFEEVPEQVLQFMRDLPDTDKEPAWV